MKIGMFSAVDTLFFKESRPMEAPGSSELASVFPPPIRTIAGAIRSHIGETNNVDWTEYAKDKNHALREVIGYGDKDYADIALKGVWLHYQGQRLYPAPLNLMVQYNDELGNKKAIGKSCFLEVADPCCCDLGENVRLVSLPEDMQGSQSASNHWVTAKGFEAILANILPDYDEIISSAKFYQEENRLGLGRDNQKRVVIDGLLYQTRHLRLQPELEISVDIEGLDEHLSNGIVKLGGEGRLATMSALNPSDQVIDFPKPPTNSKDANGLIIYLLTPLVLPEGSAFLPGFKKSEENTQQTEWKGEINQISLKLISSVIGKTQREGGWDIAKHKPIAVKSMIPAGSIFYCEVAEGGDLSQVVKNLNNTQIGEQQHLGRGHIAAGLWFANKTEGQNS